ncbi:FG-GAP-like repeat-containing protein [Acaryochloris sp. CCMEE 5410]|uniref:FG-GAP-like repeat-containing protein n=1 Tax=Acaryochloris sp. CCMEE 5410 TaxID=310037 RepID=UPI0021D24317|nr:FG-GAP-like repeat-containing protein [Acaryochloris sp. CCMEE 5410]
MLTDGASNGTPTPNAVFGPSQTAHPSFNPSTGWNSNDSLPRQVADVNGDNRADIIGFSNNGVFVALGQTDGTFGSLIAANANFTRATGWNSNDSLPRRVADVNGDNRADIIGFSNNGVFVALGQTDGTFGSLIAANANFTPATGWNSNDSLPRQVADVNGDNRADIIGFSNNGVFVALGQTDGTFGPAIAANANFTRATGWNSNDRLPRQVADVNGDGRADIVGFSNNGVFVALGQTDGTFSTATLANANFTPATGWNSNDTLLRLVADVNGDNRADIVGFAGDGTYVALGQTDGTFGPVTLATQQFSPQQGFTSQAQQLRLIADIDGNGRGDIVGFGSTGVGVAASLIVDDVLTGDAGNDRLVGGAGSDLLTGGADADTFVFDANAAVSGTNQITDFNAAEGDRLEIAQAAFGSEITFNSTTGELTVAGTYNNTLAVLTNPSGFDVNTHITLV